MREYAKCLGKLQDGTNMECVKFGNPAPKLQCSPSRALVGSGNVAFGQKR